MGAIIGSRGALSLTSFNVTTNDRGDDAATPVFSRATTWKRKRPGLGGSRSRFSSLTTRMPDGSIAKKFVVNSKVYAGFGSSGPWIRHEYFIREQKRELEINNITDRWMELTIESTNNRKNGQFIFRSRFVKRKSIKSTFSWAYQISIRHGEHNGIIAFIDDLCADRSVLVDETFDTRRRYNGWIAVNRFDGDC